MHGPPASRRPRPRNRAVGGAGPRLATYAAGVEDDEEPATPEPAEGGGPEIATVAKPDALLALHSVTAELFDTLRR